MLLNHQTQFCKRNYQRQAHNSDNIKITLKVGNYVLVAICCCCCCCCDAIGTTQLSRANKSQLSAKRNSMSWAAWQASSSTALAYQTDSFMNGINFSTGISTSTVGWLWTSVLMMMCDRNVLIMLDAEG